MCGIAGFLDNSGTLTEADLLRMNETLSRRGPDGAGHYFENGLGLAMRRLAIIDLVGGWQPAFNEDKSIVVIFNGEIYNYRELRQELLDKGHSFRTQSDSEVIAHLYEEHGDGFTTRLRGMFAIALWDARAQRLVLARDRLGLKPLYVARLGSGVIFGSELKAVMASGRVPRDIDWNAVDEYFAYTFIPAPRSIYRAVTKFLPAHQASLGRDGTYSESRYWNLPRQDSSGLPENDREQQLEAALLAAVECHMVSDVPVGAFLSGGVDSSLIVAMMTRFTDRPVQTFTVGFAGANSGFIDERVYARELAARYRLQHNEIEVTPDATAILPDIVAAFDEPFADDSVIPSYYISQATARSVKVAMTGLGGDELFAGYRRHLGVRLAARYRMIPKLLRQHVLAPAARWLPELPQFGDAVDHIKRFTRAGDDDGALQYQDYLSTQPCPQRLQIFQPHIRNRIVPGLTEAVAVGPFRNAPVSDDLERALRTDLQLYLPDDILALTDRLSMWHSLELRLPFLDPPLVKLAAQLPPEDKIRGTTQKRILKSIAKNWVPESILTHRKQGFEAPMGAWLRGPLLPLLDERLAGIGSNEVFDTSVLRRLRDEHVGGMRKNNKLLFSFLMFTQWAHQNGIALDRQA